MDATADTSKRNRSLTRQPVILVLSCFALGIVFDRYIDPLWQALLAGSVLGLVSWLLWFRFRRSSLASCSICLSAIAVGGLWHHVWWNVFPSDDVAFFANDLAAPQRVRAVVLREPRWIVAPEPDIFESTPAGIRTRLVLQVESIQQAAGWTDASGSMPSYVDGQLSGFAVGDHIEAIGLLALQRAAHNPGQFDLRDFCRSERQLCSFSILHPEAIVLTGRL